MDVMMIVMWIVYFISLYFVIFWFLVFLDYLFLGDRPTKKTTRYPIVTIAIPAYNEAHRGLEETIQSALALDYPQSKLQILAIDHGSTDDTLSIMNKYKDKITVLSISRTAYDKKGVAMNVALKHAKGKYFVSFDADSTVSEDALKKVLPHFDREDIAAVLPFMKIRNPQNVLQKLQWYEYLINMFYKKLMSFLNCVQVAPGPFAVYNTKILREVGGYANDNLVEDFELTLRMQRHHYKIIQAMDTCVYTLGNKTLKSLHKQRHRWYQGTLLNLREYKQMMLNKEYGDFGLIQLPMIAASVVVSFSLILSLLIYNIKNISNFVQRMLVTNFDLLTYFRSFDLSIDLLNLNYINLLIGTMMFGMTLLIFILSHKIAEEKTTKHGLISMVFFFLYYFFIMAAAWMTSLWAFVFKKDKISKW
jgi:cellulose synthase/poly-beta-1,6-N-acetylglucosamine synthase-like glycosyltransferase